MPGAVKVWQRSEKLFLIYECASRKDALGKLHAESSVPFSGHCLELIYAQTYLA